MNMAMGMAAPSPSIRRAGVEPLSRSLLAVRVGSVLAGFVLGALVVTNGMASSLAQSQPEQALRLAPYSARALAVAAAERIGADLSPGAAALAGARARAALRRDLTQVDAVATLGALADLQRDLKRSTALMQASDRLSRRNLLTRLWFIETAVKAGDAPGALRHFDIALRTSTVARGLLFPVLNSALADDALVRPIADALQQRPPWAADFIYGSASSGTSIKNLAKVVATLDPMPVYPNFDLRRYVMDGLIAKNELEQVRALGLSALPPTVRRQTVIDPSFADKRGEPPVTWELKTTPMVAERSVDPQGASVLRIDAPAQSGGIAASQLLALAQGSYVLTSAESESDFPENERPSWSVACAQGDEPSLAQLELPPSRARVRTRFTVPAGCAVQWLRLVLKSHDDPQGRSLAIRDVRIIKVE
jgi:hypothetical protein